MKSFCSVLLVTIPIWHDSCHWLMVSLVSISCRTLYSRALWMSADRLYLLPNLVAIFSASSSYSYRHRGQKWNIRMEEMAYVLLLQCILKEKSQKLYTSPWKLIDLMCLLVLLGLRCQLFLRKNNKMTYQDGGHGDCPSRVTEGEFGELVR